MQLLKTAIWNGTIKGLKTTFMLLKIVLPIYAAVVFIKYSPVMPFLQNTFASSMKFFHLPGDAIIPLVTGMFLDEYSTITVMGMFDFTRAQITTMAMFILVFHSVPVEAAIAQKLGLSAAKFIVFRLISAVIIGLTTGWIGGMFA